MLSSVHDPKLSAFVGKALKGFVSELRALDIVDLIAYARLGLHREISHLVQDAADLFFMPRFIDLSCPSEVDLDWHSSPQITLHLVMKSAAIEVYFSLKLSALCANINIDHISLPHLQSDFDTSQEIVLAELIRANVIESIVI